MGARALGGARWRGRRSGGGDGGWRSRGDAGGRAHSAAGGCPLGDGGRALSAAALAASRDLPEVAGRESAAATAIELRLDRLLGRSRAVLLESERAGYRARVAREDRRFVESAGMALAHRRGRVGARGLGARGLGWLGAGHLGAPLWALAHSRARHRGRAGGRAGDPRAPHPPPPVAIAVPTWPDVIAITAGGARGAGAPLPRGRRRARIDARWWRARHHCHAGVRPITPAADPRHPRHARASRA